MTPPLLSFKTREHQLREKIETAKRELARLQDKRRLALGQLACKHGLDAFEETVLDQRFAQLAQTLTHEYSSHH